MKKIFNSFIYLILTLNLLIISSLNNVFAAGHVGGLPDLFSPAAKNDDFLIKFILKPIFGYGQGYNYEDNPFGLFSSIFLSGLIILAAILIIYTTLVGLTDTANSGQLLNKKGTLTWTTLRSVTGIGLLIPLGKSGFSAIQYIVLWVAVQGVLFADTAWEKFISSPYTGNIQQTSLLKRQLLTNVEQLFLVKVCILANNDSQFNSTAVGKDLEWGYTSKEMRMLEEVEKKKEHKLLLGMGHNETGSRYSFKEAMRYSFGAVNSEAKTDRAICGVVEHDKNSNVQKKDSAFLFNGKDLSVKINNLHYEKTKAWIEEGEIDRIAKLYLKDIKEGQLSDEDIILNLSKNFQALINQYYNEIYALASEVKGKELDKAKIEELKKEGFAAAGSWFFRLANDLDTISHAMHTTSNLVFTSDNVIKAMEKAEERKKNGGEAGTWEKIGNFITFNGYKGSNTLSELNEDKFNTLKIAMTHLIGVKKFISVSPADSTLTIYAEETAETDGKKLMKGINAKELGNSLSNHFKQNSIENLTGNNLNVKSEIRIGNPLIQIQTLGNNLVNIAVGGLIALLGLGTIGSLILGSKMTAIATFVAPFVVIIITAILLPAVMMAFYIPLVPFILWMGALFGWLVLVVEALFGAPMWAVTFLTPDRDGFIGKQGQGYMLILTLFLRPVLMVLGFIAALHLLTPIIDMLNYFFLKASNAVWGRTTGLTWLTGFLAILIIYYIIINKTVLQILSLIHKVPDTLLQWIGGSHSQILGQYAEGVEKGVSNASLTAMAGANSAVNKLGNTVEDKMKNLNNKKKNDEEKHAQEFNKFINGMDGGDVGMNTGGSGENGGDLGSQAMREKFKELSKKDLDHQLKGSEESPDASANKKAMKDLQGMMNEQGLDNKINSLSSQQQKLDKALQTGKLPNGDSLSRKERKQIREARNDNQQTLDGLQSIKSSLDQNKQAGLGGNTVEFTKTDGNVEKLGIADPNFNKKLMDMVNNKSFSSFQITNDSGTTGNVNDPNDYT